MTATGDGEPAGRAGRVKDKNMADWEEKNGTTERGGIRNRVRVRSCVPGWQTPTKQLTDRGRKGPQVWRSKGPGVKSNLDPRHSRGVKKVRVEK